MVMIGDSYSAVAPWRGVSYPWPERVRDGLGLPEQDCTIYRHSGYGFAKPQRHFASLLSGAERDPSVTDVLIVGGAGNDVSCSEEQIRTWYRLTIERLRLLYPRAKIMHTITSWDVNNKAYRAQMLVNIPIYQALAKQCNVTYLHGCETIIRGHPEYFSDDGRHPTDQGQQAMSAVIVEKIRSYNKRYVK